MKKWLIILSLVASGSALAQARVQPPQAPVLPPQGAPQSLPPGLYVQVTDGAIQVGNPGGTLVVSAGQFGYVPNPNAPPVVLPNNPGLHFVPPPVFNTGSGGPPPSGGGKTGTVDCEVR